MSLILIHWILGGSLPSRFKLISAKGAYSQCRLEMQGL